MGTSLNTSDTDLILGASGTAVASTITAWSSIAAGANVVPVIGSIVGGLVGVGIAMAKLAQGCGPTCTNASRFADEAQRLLIRNNDEYFAIPADKRTADVQAQALYNVDQIFRALGQACGQASLGPAGQRCIQERLVEGNPAPWCPTPDHRGCDWVTAYRNPIANDAVVSSAPMSNPVTQTGNAITNSIAKVSPGLAETLSKPVMIGDQPVSMGVILLCILALVIVLRSVGE